MRRPSTRKDAGCESDVIAAASAATTAVVATVLRLGSLVDLSEIFAMGRLVDGLGVEGDDDLLDFDAQRSEEFGFREGPDEFALPINRALALAPRDADVGHLAFAWAIDNATHDCDLNGGLVFLRDRFDRAREIHDFDFGTAARRARGDVEAFFADLQRLENAPA